MDLRAERSGPVGADRTPAPAGTRDSRYRALPFALGLAAPFLISACTRFLQSHAEAIYRDAVPLLLVLVFAAFTAISLRRLPGRIGFVVAGLYLGATLGTMLDLLAFPDPGRHLLGEILALWWLAAPGMVGGVMLGGTRRRHRFSGSAKRGSG